MQLAAIYTQFHKVLLGFIKSKVSNHQDAEDILHNVFIKVAEGVVEPLPGAITLLTLLNVKMIIIPADTYPRSNNTNPAMIIHNEKLKSVVKPILSAMAPATGENTIKQILR